MANGRSGEQKQGGRDGQFRVRRFDADRTDVELTFEQALAARPTARQLLWIDISGDLDTADATRLADRFSLDARARHAAESQPNEPYAAFHGGYFHVRVAAEPSDKRPRDTAWLDVVGAKNTVITWHRAEIEFLQDLDEQIEADASVGVIDAGTFVASLLGRAVTSFFAAVDAIEEDVDGLDARSLRDDGREQLLEDLVSLRRRVAGLRRVLTAHRTLYAKLGAPEVAELVGNPEAAAALQQVSNRFEAALGAVEDTRDALLGSFDVYMTRTAQRTNDVMKLLALVTVLLLPGSLIAGLLGMNVDVPLPKDNPASFWFVITAVVVVALLLVALARARRWL